MAVLLALIAAATWGVSDFLGGMISKRFGAWVTSTAIQVGALGATAIAVIWFGGTPTPADWVWGSIGGIGMGVGTVFLFRGLANGRMAVVAPVSAVGTALVPITVGLAGGERPGLLASVGIALALPAIWLISGSEDTADEPPTPAVSSGIRDGALAGLGFGVDFTCLDQLTDDSGLTPLLATMAVALIPVIGLAVLTGQRFWPRTRSEWLLPVAISPLGIAATVCLLWAVQVGMLSVTSVLVSLYPAATVALAATILRERIHRAQGWGLVLAALAVGLISQA